MCFCMSIGLYSADIFVWGGNSTNGSGTRRNPYKYISSAINAAQNNQQSNTIYIRGIQNGAYTQNISISGFEYSLTLQRWHDYDTEVKLAGTGTANSVLYIGSNSAAITIRDITIARTTNPSGSSQLHGGGICVFMNASTYIDNCIIHDNRAYKGGGLYAYSSNVEVLNSRFYNNNGLYYGGPLIMQSFGGAIYGENANIIVYGTVLNDNASGGLGYGECNETIFMDGGSLNCVASTLIHDSILAVVATGVNQTFLNCIIYGPFQWLEASYYFCCAYNTQLSGFGGVGNFVADPGFVDPQNGDYALLKGSPCIGSGYSELYYDYQGDPWNQDLITIHDETQDMGAIPYDFDRYATYTFDDDPQGNWMCFPVLDDISYKAIGGVPYRTDNMRAFFNDYEGSQSVMNRAMFKWYDPQNLFGGNTHYPDDVIMWHYMRGINHDEGFLGYKVLFDDVTVTEKFHGYHILPEAVVQVPEPGVENWIGYFLPVTQTPQQAFGAYLDELYYIQHKDWTMTREMVKRNSPWIVPMGVGDPAPSISYGEMVIVKRFGPDGINPEICEFQWANTGQSREYSRQQPEYFNFAKEASYTAVFVEMDADTSAKEIAILSNDVCYGAAVVSEGIVMIPAYISSLPVGSELQLVSWDGAKSANSISSISQFNPEQGSFARCSSFLKTDADSYYIKTGEGVGENNTPMPTGFSIKNYPNPFNPSTTIMYNLSEEAEVKIEIFNSRGQLVKTLVNDFKDAGSYHLVWNGQDQNNRTVASGVYYSRIETNGKSLTHKMLLLK